MLRLISIYFLLINLIGLSHGQYPNILENSSNIIVSQYLHTSSYNITNLVNKENNKFSTGTITTLPQYIYFNLPSKYYTSKYKFIWNQKPKSYKFYKSNNCNYSNFNYTYEDTNFSDVKKINYNTTPPWNCSIWEPVPEYYFNNYVQYSEAWICGSLFCYNIDDYISSNFLLEILELESTQSSIVIDRVEVEGLDTATMVELVTPEDVPFNISTDVMITEYEDYHMSQDVKLGNHDCSKIFNNLTKYDSDNYTGDIFDTVSPDDGSVYSVNGHLNNNEDYYICYRHNYPFSNLYFPQTKPIKMYKINSIQPSIIQKSSSYILNISSNYPYTEYISLARDGECGNEMYSITEIISKNAIFYDNTDEIGKYFVCYSLNDHYWAQQSLTMDIVLAEIFSVSGCEDHMMMTIDCPTEGGNLLFIYGSDFDTLHTNPVISIGDYDATNITIVNTSLITCTLPQGMGIDLSINIRFSSDIYSPGMLSYKMPEIISLEGCEQDANDNFKIKNCPNDGDFLINIIGNNFGYDYSKVLVGSQFCSNIVHHSHRNISCILQGANGVKKSLFVIQYQGEISEGKNYLSFKECNFGYEYVDGDCEQCIPGKYKDTVGDTYCSTCSDNTFTDENGMSECKYCSVGKQVAQDSSVCEECGDRYYKNDITSISCSQCLENQITYNTTESTCYFCNPGYEVIDNNCVACSKGYFKEESNDFGCLFCEDGKYSNSIGATSCEKCPDNSKSNSFRDGCECNVGYYDNNDNSCIECDNLDFHGDIIYICNKEDLNIHEIKNNLGYWRPNKDSTNFYECKLPEHCPSNNPINDSIICLENHRDILCNLCVDNFEKDQDELCYECSSSDKTRVKSLTITYFIIGIIGFIFIITLILIGGRGWLHKIVSFMKSNGFIEETKENSEVSSFTTESSDISSNTNSNNSLSNQSTIWSSSSNSSLSSIDSNLSPRLTESNLRKRNSIIKEEKNDSETHTETNTQPISTLEIVKENKFLSFADNIQQKIKILISYLQVMSLLSSNLNITWPDFIKSVINGFNFVNLDILSISRHDLSCSFNTNFYNNLILHILTIPSVILFIYISYLIALALKIKYKLKRGVIKDRFIYCLVFFVFILYPSVGCALLKIFKCDLIEEEWYLSQDLSLKCFDKEWTKYAILSGCFIFIYIIGIPLFFYYLMKRNLEIVKISNDENQPQTKQTKRFAYRYGFMYMGYENKYWWFELVEMMKKIVLLATVIYLDESATRILIAMLMCFGYLGYVSYNKPLKYDDDDYLNVLSAAEIFLMLLCGLVLEVKLDVQDAYNEYAFQGFMFVLLIGIVVVGNYEILKSLFGGNIKLTSILKAIYNTLHNKTNELYQACCKAKNLTLENYDSDDLNDLDDLDDSNDEGEDSNNNELKNMDKEALSEKQEEFVKTQTLNIKNFMESIV